MTDIEKAKDLLHRPGTTCALCRGEIVYTSQKTGISPMLEFLAEGVILEGFSAADKIIGKAAAMLFARARVSEVFGEVMSSAAVSVLERYGIRASFGTLTDGILNRTGDGPCPMEATAAGIDSPAEAEAALRNKLAQLRGGKSV